MSWRIQYGRAHFAPLACAIVVLAGLTIPLTSHAQECGAWQIDLSTPTGRTTPAMVFDEARGRTVLFGGSDGIASNETWEWDGQSWIRIAIASPPLGRAGHAMAYDAARQKVVLFGGLTEGGGVLGDTWEYDGATWTQRIPAGAAPAGRWGHAIAFDRERERTVLFGGNTQPSSSAGRNGETWEWDGAAWALVCTNCGPSARYVHTLVYDEMRHYAVLFGGLSAAGLSSDVWEYNGAWRAVSATGPSGRVQHAAAYDANRRKVVAFGGQDGFSFLADSWLFDGVAWQVGPTGPPQRAAHAMCYDSGRGACVMFGGARSSGEYTARQADLWELTDQWSLRISGPPLARRSHAMVNDSARDVVVMFGGLANSRLGDTWERTESGWHERVVPGPSPRHGHGMVFDSRRSVTVLFGGYLNNFSPSGQTWEWDGTAWTLRVLQGASPPARLGQAMAFDEDRGVTVLFGGNPNSSTQFGDTWLYDGDIWWQPQIAGAAPAARTNAAMAYDANRRVVVMHGGRVETGNSSELWEWDGVAWQLRTPGGPSPGGRSSHAMAYDPARRTIVMAGRAVGCPVGSPTAFEYDGVEWRQMTGVIPPPRTSLAMVFDTRACRVRVYSGVNPCVMPHLYCDEWTLGGVAPPVVAEPISQRWCGRSDAQFTIETAACDPYTVRWLKDDEPLSDGPQITGAQTSTLTIHTGPQAMFGRYSADVMNECGTSRSRAAWLTPCSGGDLNCDGALDFFDVDPFLLALFDPSAYEQAYPTCFLMRGDLNADGHVNFFDVDAFVSVLIPQ